MNINEAIEARHAVRSYQSKPLPTDVVAALNEKINECNRLGRLHIQLVQGEQRAFQGRLAKYGKFSGVENYLVVAGPKDSTLDERAGYYGEQLVLLAQMLGLNSCWVGLSYSKVPGTYTLAEGEKVACYIALGYGTTQGVSHKVKAIEQVSNASDATPAWFRKGVEAALLAPTAINQQRFHFEYVAPANGAKARVKATRSFSLTGYTQMDLGIAKCHFEIGAGREMFEWA